MAHAACTLHRTIIYVDPNPLLAYTACRLIPLNKCPGVLPIGIVEVGRRIIEKALVKTTRLELQNTAGPFVLAKWLDVRRLYMQ